ncbi:short-chain dehydrogenase TIC 32, chloroplastic-like [Arachis stenosperma]|uniref:short-chain dehydrogenase TIC 32, chloroplastic-like n=1 Tax=Arachis stenosperma TaxID=217475 RepID=UPI0025AC448F|nr:short-chain dehydrogenase TIC 32, chloroplastic-like [Arachis stenosperma]
MWLMSRKGGSGFSSSSTAEQVTHCIDATGRTAIVTGATSGIGAETARVLALRGVHVIMGNSRPFMLSKDNIELQFATNHLGNACGTLTYNFSGLRYVCYHSWLAYRQSKLANILHANELARRLKGDGGEYYRKFPSSRSSFH